jgi:hypothetical protein
MQIKTPLLLSVCLSLFSSFAFAAASAAVSPIETADFSPPAPVSVTPIRSAAHYENCLIKLELLVDAEGRPQRVDTLGLVPVSVQESVVGAVKKWKFRPATRNGVPVSARVILPLMLVAADT